MRSSFISGVAFVALGVVSSVASAAIVTGGDGIGVQFNAGGNSLGASNTAGVPSVAQDHWNSLSGSNFASVALNNDGGVATATTLTSGSPKPPGYGTYNWNGPSNFLNNDKTLARGQIFAGGGKASLTVGSIPYTTYDVYVYGVNDNNTVLSVFTLTPSAATPQSLSFKTKNDGTGWVQGTNTWNGVGPAPAVFPQANYVVFTGLTASSFNLSWAGRNAAGDGFSGNSPINGFQIVSVVPEPTALGLVGVSSLALIARRRRTA